MLTTYIFSHEQHLKGCIEHSIKAMEPWGFEPAAADRFGTKTYGEIADWIKGSDRRMERIQFGFFKYAQKLQSDMGLGRFEVGNGPGTGLHPRLPEAGCCGCMTVFIFMAAIPSVVVAFKMLG